MSKYFCPMPFVNIEARTDGTIGVCCQLDNVIRQPNGRPYNLGEHVLSDGWNSEWVKDLRDQFLAGEKPSACYSCWTAEDAGIDSKRLRALRDFPDVLDRVQAGTQQSKPVSMDLKLGNICNNRCRICSSYASSLWVPEEKARDGDSNRFWDDMRQAGRWPERNSAFWDDFRDFSSDVELMEFYGGEPLLINEHYDILQNLVDTGRSSNIVLMYNTNGSVWPKRGIDLWPHFKRVLLSFSIDGVGAQFEYIRNPAKWATVTDHLQRLQALNMPNLRLDICYTVSIFNIYYMDQILAWQQADFPNIPVYYNHVYTPQHLSCKVLPRAVKLQIYKKFVNHPSSDVQSSLKYCMDVDYDDSLMQLFYKHTIFSDNYREEKFSQTFPEYYEILKNQGGAPEEF